MTKKSPWQKLKDENEKLKKDLRELVLNPDSLESIVIKNSVKFSMHLENMMFQGVYGKCEIMEGFLKSLS